MSVNKSESPLTGLKVVDFSTLLPGPYASMLLADMGADVIRVESVTRPDLVKSLPPMVGDRSAADLQLNRNKRSIAIDLKPSDFKTLAKAPKPLLTGLASQFLLLPSLTFAFVWITAPQPSIALGLMLVAACPGGNVSNFITHRARGNVALSVSMTAFSTVGAIFLTPLNIAFWGSLYPPTRQILRETSLDPLSVAITVGVLLVLPLCLGILLNLKKPDLTSRLRTPLQYVSMGIFSAFIVLALAAR